MAGIKSTHLLDDRKAGAISTSGIFKTHRNHIPLKGERKRLVGLQFHALPKKRKHKPKSEHWLSKEFSESVGKSRKHIEKTTISELDAACNGLVTQTLSIMQSARDRMEEVDANTDNIAKPLSDELLELTRKDGTSITTSLGKRMKAYRELVTREEKTLNELFEQWVEVSRRIDDFGTKHFGPTGVKSLKSKTNADMAECEGGEEQEVVARLAAERKRVLDAAAAAGEKAMKAVRANETQLKLENQQRMQQVCDSMFDEGDELVAA